MSPCFQCEEQVGRDMQNDVEEPGELDAVEEGEG